jgi:hypothetical protein
VPEVDDRRQLEILGDAVRELIEAGELSPEEGLSHVVWPSPEVVEATRELAAEHTGPTYF